MQQTMGGFVGITQPTAGQTVASPVIISGNCSPGGQTITVKIGCTATTSTTARTITATGTNWTSGGFALNSGSGYTAFAAGDGSDSKGFAVR